MSKVKIVQAGHPVLRSPAEPVAPERIGTPEIKNLVRRMVEAMRAAPGVGLAAPQVGVPLQIIVLEDDEPRMSRMSKEQREERGRVAFPLKVIFNPTLSVVGEGRGTYFEGCLSVAGYMALVERDLEVEVTGLDANAKPLVWRVRGWPARILQHEVDHLRGTLYVDRMLTRSFVCNDEAAARWQNLPVDEVRKALGA